MAFAFVAMVIIVVVIAVMVSVVVLVFVVFFGFFNAAIRMPIVVVVAVLDLHFFVLVFHFNNTCAIYMQGLAKAVHHEHRTRPLWNVQLISQRRMGRGFHHRETLYLFVGQEYSERFGFAHHIIGRN